MVRRRPGGEAAVDGAKDADASRPLTFERLGSAVLRTVESARDARARRRPRNLVCDLRLLRPWDSVVDLWTTNLHIAILSIRRLAEG
jgi:hypothetical protein